mgnify:CR=1 FL=1
MDQLVVLIVILLIGAWFSWRDISNGRGWMCRFLSAETLQSLNSDGGQVKKALLSVVVGYATICVTIVKWLFLLAIRLLRIKQSRAEAFAENGDETKTSGCI